MYILQKLQDNSHKGYKLGDISHVTLLNADNFCLISTHKTTHRNLINSIHTQIHSMGMKLKPSKCHSLSLSKGRPKAVLVNIGESEISSKRDEEQKFLGKLLFFKGKSEATFNLIKDTFTEGIASIEKAMVKNKFKLWTCFPLK